MVIKSLEKVKFSCHKCSETKTLDYDTLNENIKSGNVLNFGNISELVKRFVCSSCRQNPSKYSIQMTYFFLIQTIM